MGHSASIITAPVNTDDVRLTIGENSDDVGTLCKSGKINEKSLFKPVRLTHPRSVAFTTYGADNDCQRVSEYGSYIEVAGYKVTCADAVNLTTATFCSTFGNAKWERQALDYFCLDHFVGYNHSVRGTWPILHCMATGGAPITVDMFSEGVGTKFLLTPYNIPYFKDMYYGVGVFRQVSAGNYSVVDIKCCSETICPFSRGSDGSANDNLSIQTLTFGNAVANAIYVVIPFIAQKKINSHSDLRLAGKIYSASFGGSPLNNGLGQKVGPMGGVITASTAATLRGLFSMAFANGNTSSPINVTITFSSTFAEAKTVSNIKLHIRVASSNGTILLNTTEDISGTVSVPAKTASAPGTAVKTHTYTRHLSYSNWDTVAMYASFTYTNNGAVNVQTQEMFLSKSGFSPLDPIER